MANNSKWNNVFQPIVLMDSDGLPNLNSKSQNFCNSNNLMGCQANITNGGTNLFNTSPTGFSVSNYGMNINVPTSPIDLFPSINVFGNNEGTNGQSQNSSSRQSTTSSISYTQSDNNSLASRETGIIEKLLHSYGFIQCCERQARLFFHFSQFNGTIEHLKIGDPVEFEMTYDRRTGKPIASSVTKICPEVLNAERAVGVVTSALKKNSDLQGRITYESSGECFFLPFNKQDVEGNVILQVGDEVSFQIATNNKGNLSATHVRMENAVNPVKYQGVICSIKQVYGSIERADVVKEIYFHTEQLSRHVDLFCGDDVEFNIRMEHGREMAYNVSRLPKGSVIFEDICDKVLRGQVLKPIDTSRAFGGDPLAGRLKYRAEDHTEVELPFGLKDQKGCFTLRHGDWVEFNIATDRRDKMDRAVNITLLEDSFQVSGERREQGSVAYIRDHFGFIYPVDKDMQISFSLNEVLSVDKHVEIGDEVEFTIIQECSLTFTNPKKVATRIKLLPKGSIVFDNLVHAHLTGCISRLPLQFTMQGDSFFMDSGLITYHSGGVNCTATLYAKDLDRTLNLKVGDKVSFKLYQIIRNKELIAKDVKGLLPRMNLTPLRSANEINSNSYVFTNETSQGFIIGLKDSYGFIEMANLQKEIFFLYKDIDRDRRELDIGMEVEFTSGRSSNKICTSMARSVKVIPTGTIHGSEEILKQLPVVHGKVKRTLRTLNPAQRCYSGLIEEDATNGERGALREFGVMGLKYKRDFIQEGDVVRFQVNCMDQAFNIEIEREVVRSTVASIITPGKHGFLSLEVNGKKLFFHMSHVRSKGELEVGDEVDCSVVTNQRTGKVTACAINRISEPQQKPKESCRVRETPITSTTKTTIIRQPEGPDGKHGFHYKKKHVPFCSKKM